MSEPRDPIVFWFEFKLGDNENCSQTTVVSMFKGFGDNFKVIEYSAYEQVVKERDEQREIAKVRYEINHTLMRDMDRISKQYDYDKQNISDLKEKLNIALDALRELQTYGYQSQFRMIDEAIATIGVMK